MIKYIQEAPILRLQMPYSDKPGEYFSFRLRQELQAEPGLYRASEKILILSNIEGDFWAFQRLLVKNGVIDNRHHWTFDNGHLVIVGNCFDRFGYAVECLWLVYSLEEKAKRAGGHVHFILGDYEILNLDGEWRYSHPRYATSAGGRAVVTALYDGNYTLWHWLRTKNVIEKIGDVLIMNKVVFLNIDLPSYSIAEINQVVRLYSTVAVNELKTPLFRNIFDNIEFFLESKGRLQDISSEKVSMAIAHWNTDVIVAGYGLILTDSTSLSRQVISISDKDEGLLGILIKKKRYYRVDINGNRERIYPFVK